MSGSADVIADMQTGAGKTYTLSNTEANAIGMMPRACLQVFTQISQQPAGTFTVFMSIVQLYTERIQVVFHSLCMMPGLHKMPAKLGDGMVDSCLLPASF